VLAGALFGKTVSARPEEDDGGGAPAEPPEPKPVSVVCTSATLATESGFGFAKSELGVGECAELVVESPFDYPNQALLILPEVCDPNDALFTSACAAILLRTIVLARGRTLGLFTSRKRMNEVYDLIAGQTPYRILKQDDGQRTQLVEEFRRDTHSVLLGVSSFWAGVDVPGESLSVVWIDKIPFPAPDDPVVERLTETDKRAWHSYAVPRAIIEFKQGFGRLIRSSTDRGVVVCCDARLQTKSYGKQFLRAMPKGMQKVRSLESIREWLDGPDTSSVPESSTEIDPFS
jgi:ATP-dependent DNA helicase DinG